MAKQIVLPYPPQDREQLWWAVRALFGVIIPRVQVCPDHCSPFQAFADAYFRECTLPGFEGPISRAIWWASRGLAGKSKTLSILGLTFGYIDGADITILGGSMAQSSNVHEYMVSAMDFEGVPEGMTLDQTATKIKLSNKARIRPLPASQRNVRGPHPSILLVDEADEMELDIYDAALGQPLPQPNYLGETVDTFTVVSSTYQNADGVFTEILKRAEESHQPTYQWCTAVGSLVTTARGLVPIEDVHLDDLVLTRKGWRDVQHVTLMGVKETVTLRAAGGYTLTCTPDHLVSTTRGWVEAGSLSESDSLHVIGALPTVSSPIRTLVQVGARVGVTVGAVDTSELALDNLPASDIHARGDHFEMVRITAGPNSAQMVDSQPGWDITSGQPDGQPVSELLSPDVRPHGGLSIPAGTPTALPDPATVVVDNGPFPDVFEAHVESVTPGAYVAVYDIGVMGEHEFVANGVVVHNCFRETSNEIDGWLKEKMIQEKRDSISLEMFRVEYDLGEPAIGNRAFNTELVDKAFSLKFKPDDKVGLGFGYIEHKESKDFQEYRFAGYDPMGTYVTSADWAKEQDKTVIAVARVYPHHRELVYLARMNRRPYPIMIKYLNDAIEYYRVQENGTWHDSTGLGNVINDLLDTRARPFSMTGDKRAVMLSDFVNAIEKGTWRIPRIKEAYSEMKYCRTGDLYKPTGDYASATGTTGPSKQFHLPDIVCALALAEYASKRVYVAAPPSVIKRDNQPHGLEKEFSSEMDLTTHGDEYRSPISLVV